MAYSKNLKSTCLKIWEQLVQQRGDCVNSLSSNEPNQHLKQKSTHFLMILYLPFKIFRGLERRPSRRPLKIITKKF